MRWIIIWTLVLGLGLGLGIQIWADELHVVKKGDTLWDICDHYYHNPYLWPKLWQINPHVTNPHWIYPGDVLCLKETPEELIQAAKEVKKGIKSKKRKKFPLDWRYREAAGYLLPSPEKPRGEIIKAVGEDKVVLGEGDLIYVKFQSASKPEVGSVWTIFRISPPILHPVSKQEIGYLHEILGVIKITKLYPQVAEAKIIRSYDVVYIGDFLKPYQPPKPFSLCKEKPPSLQAWVVATKGEISEIAWPDVLYIDAGETQGLKTGQTLEIFRKEAKDLPPLFIGKVLIIYTTPQTATAMILESKRSFHAGDIVGVTK